MDARLFPKIKMVAKIISHDVSEEKGPAAEGVALKII